MPRIRSLVRYLAVLPLLLPVFLQAAPWNGYSMQRFTTETPHFTIYYHKGIEHLVRPVAEKLEELYTIYGTTYHFKLPNKTQILLQDGDGQATRGGGQRIAVEGQHGGLGGARGGTASERNGKQKQRGPILEAEAHLRGFPLCLGNCFRASAGHC